MSSSPLVTGNRPEEGRIPRILHRIWLGPKPFSLEFAEYGRRWQSLHPTWEVRLWRDDDLPVLQNAELYDRVKAWSSRADIARLEILLQFGGVYADCDVQPLRPLDDLLAGAGFVAGWEDEDRVNNAVMASVPNHPLVRAMVDGIPGRADEVGVSDPDIFAGPGYLTDQLRAYSEQPSVRLYPPEFFYPYHYHQKWRRHERFPDAYTVHHWAHTWSTTPPTLVQSMRRRSVDLAARSALVRRGLMKRSERLQQGSAGARSVQGDGS
jgi:mannosyltransferase OCH1-like enzyme